MAGVIPVTDVKYIPEDPDEEIGNTPLDKVLDDKYKAEAFYRAKAAEEKKVLPATFNDKGKHAIFILGPSAVGKTKTTTLGLGIIAEKNGWCKDLKYYSVDGGMVTLMWQPSSLAHACHPCARKQSDSPHHHRWCDVLPALTTTVPGLVNRVAAPCNNASRLAHDFTSSQIRDVSPTWKQASRS